MPSWCIWSMASIISIHAPARGATKVTVHFNQNHSNISIHAPARGATGDAKDIWLAVRNFNPRSREGSDIQPTRNKRETADKFQSTLPRGERHHSVAFSVFLLPFQSTLPRGERHARAETDVRKKNFNPRSREGSDCDRVGRFREVCKFQSTLPRGERRFAICSPSLILGISIHAPARGATAPRTLRF